MKKVRHISNLLLILIAILCMAAVQSCAPDKPVPKLLVNVNGDVKNIELSMDVIQNQKTFKITSKTDWTITAPGLSGTNGGWYTVSAVGGKVDAEISVAAKTNDTGAERTVVLTVKGKNNEITVTLKQAAGGEDMLVVSPDELTPFAVTNAPTQTFEITTPFTWAITFKDKSTYIDPENPAIDPEWASVNVVEGEGDKTITVTAKDNNTGDLRAGEFTITAAGKTKTVAITQHKTIANDTFGSKFFAWCIDPAKGKVDTDGDGSISITEAEAVTNIDCRAQNLTSIKGVENFPNLSRFIADSNQLTEVDVSKNTKLTFFGITWNQVTALDLSNSPDLTILYCSDNKITELDFSKNSKLQHVYCSKNELTTLNVSTCSSLTVLEVHENKLSTLDVSANPVLSQLKCHNNQLTELDVRANPELFHLECGDNKISSLNLLWNRKLQTLICPNNGMIALDLSRNEALTNVNCSNNALESLSVYNCPDLTNLNCSNLPGLRMLDLSDFSFEKLVTLNIKGISTGAQISVWDGFTTEAIPSTWSYDTGVVWMYPNLNDTFGSNFFAWCIDPAKGKVDTNNDGVISTKEALAVTNLDCRRQNLTSVKGVENFPNLSRFIADSNQLTEVDVSKNTKLTFFGITWNQVTALDLSNSPDLTHLYCSDNKITELDFSKNSKLTLIHCARNELITLNINTCSSLTGLEVQQNKLSTLDVSKNPKLNILNCSINELLTLDVRANLELFHLDCGNNKIPSLNLVLNKKLQTLFCPNNGMIALDLGENEVLTNVNCSNNALESLSVYNCPKLSNLNCSNLPSLKALDVSAFSFEKLVTLNIKGISTGAQISVWDGFTTEAIPSTWQYDPGVNWSPVS